MVQIGRKWLFRELFDEALKSAIKGEQQVSPFCMRENISYGPYIVPMFQQWEEQYSTFIKITTRQQTLQNYLSVYFARPWKSLFMCSV